MQLHFFEATIQHYSSRMTHALKPRMIIALAHIPLLQTNAFKINIAEARKQ